MKDSLTVVRSIPYKIINKAIVLQFPDNKNNVEVRFKISELTSDMLKLILHETYTIKEKMKDEDIVELIFEAQK